MALSLTELARIRRQRMSLADDPFSGVTGFVEGTEFAKNHIATHGYVPPSLQPVIDLDACDRSGACVRACPEKVFSLEGNQPVVAHPEACLGHSQCISACSSGAIQLQMGDFARGRDLLPPKPNFASQYPGIYVLGELTGMGRIRQAMRQGLSLGTQLASRLPPRNGHTQLDVVVVGAGPAGLACAAQLVFAGYAVQVFEKDRFGRSIARFPRDTIYMEGPISMPGFGGFGGGLLSKTELIAQMEALKYRCHIPVIDEDAVNSVSGEHGNFVLTTDKSKVRTRVVVLATGLRGHTRHLGIDGEQQKNVRYDLHEPLRYSGKRVVIVGGGQKAITAAARLAQLPGTEVTLSYYRELSLGSSESHLLFQQGVEKGRIQIIADSKLYRITERFVEFVTQQGPKVIMNDEVIICKESLPIDTLLHSLQTTERPDNHKPPSAPLSTLLNQSSPPVHQPRPPRLVSSPA